MAPLPRLRRQVKKGAFEMSLLEQRYRTSTRASTLRDNPTDSSRR